MAKVITRITQVRLIPDLTGLAYDSAEFGYVVAADDDETLNRTGQTTVDLSAATSPVDIFSKCLAKAEADEGI